MEHFPKLMAEYTEYLQKKRMEFSLVPRISNLSCRMVMFENEVVLLTTLKHSLALLMMFVRHSEIEIPQWYTEVISFYY